MKFQSCMFVSRVESHEKQIESTTRCTLTLLTGPFFFSFFERRCNHFTFYVFTDDRSKSDIRSCIENSKTAEFVLAIPKEVFVYCTRMAHCFDCLSILVTFAKQPTLTKSKSRSKITY